MKKLTTSTLLFLVFILSGSAFAAALTDVEMYFDPVTIVPDYYPRVYLEDLNSVNSYTWDANSDDIVDTDILPVLKPGDYLLWYAYSQNDYLQIPNVDYFADITSGSLQVTFQTPGLYHVRVTRLSGSSIIYAVFAESALKEDAGSTDKTDKNKKVDPCPDGDLFIVADDDDTMDDSAKVWENNGRTVQRASSRQDVVNKIVAASKKAGKKIHVELDGHGSPGSVKMGKTGSDIRINLANVAEFQKSIDDYVNHITFQGCSTGKGKKGNRFLQILADSIGKAGAWDRPVTVVGETHFTVPTDAKFVEIVVTNTKDIQYHIPVVINCVGSTDPNCVAALIKKANAKLKKANIKLEVKQVNKNVNVGNGDNKVNEGELYDLKHKGKKELAKVIKDKKGKWTGKGLKIYIADDIWEEKPDKTNWIWRYAQCIGAEKTIDPDLLAELIRRFFNPEKIYDPTYTEGAKAEERKEAKAVGNKVKVENKNVKSDGTVTSGSNSNEVCARAAILDSLYDTVGPIDPCNPMYGYADIVDVTVESSDLSRADGQTVIRMSLNGVFPGTDPNPMLPPNPPRMFTADYQINIQYPDTTIGMINTRIWRDFPDGELRTNSWYEGPLGGFVGEALILDAELCTDPNDEDYLTNHVIELTVSNDNFFEPGSEPFEEQVVLSAQAMVEDEGLIIEDQAADYETAEATAELVFTLPHERPTISLIAPGPDEFSRGLAVTGISEPFTEFEIILDGNSVGFTTADEFGDYLYYLDSMLPLQANQLHELQITAQQEFIPDQTNITSADVEFIFEAQPLAGDIDGDDDVDFTDFALLAQNWLQGIEE